MSVVLLALIERDYSWKLLPDKTSFFKLFQQLNYISLNSLVVCITLTRN